jgi:hypothetical protein
MSDDCHRALKQYAAFMNITMGEVLFENFKSQFHKQAIACKFTADVLSKVGIDIDKRADKPCYGWRCFSCVEHKSCRVGLYKGVHVLPENLVNSGLASEAGMRELDALQRDANQFIQFNHEKP